MIKGIAKMEFGSGDILMTAVLSDKVGALCCITQEPHEINERVPNGEGWNPDDAQVILTFTKVESLDAMIAELQLLRSMMDDSYDFKDGRFYADGTIDFDRFMHKDEFIIKNVLSDKDMKSLKTQMDAGSSMIINEK